MKTTGNGDKRTAFEPWNDPAAQPFVRIDRVVKRFGDFTAVDGISLDIYRGEFFALLGPSGCGKTTLLRMLAGFERPDTGQILLEGTDVSAVPPYSRPVNMMFQSYALFPHMSVEQNVAFGLKQENIDKAQIRQRVDEILDLVQMRSFAHRRPHQLSGGQRQRVALARSLVKRPKLLLLDEPLGALDKKLREETQFELMNIQERLGTTFVIVTHDQAEAMTVSTRIAVMDRGRIVQIATPAETYEYPNSRYVADFIGDVNVFEGRVAATLEDELRIDSSEAGCAIRARHGASLPAGTQVWVALRPEKLSIDPEPPPERGVNCVQGTVRDIGYLGGLSVYHVQLDSGRTITVTRSNQSRLVDRNITWDERVWLHWRPEVAVVLVN
ncbi:MAG: ABC transporter ATP-binding protein [Gammaproteobacteria bacterium]